MQRKVDDAKMKLTSEVKVITVTTPFITDHNYDMIPDGFVGYYYCKKTIVV